MPLFFVVATVAAVICTAGLALPLVILLVIAWACRRPPVLDEPWAIATLPGRRTAPVELELELEPR